MDQKLYVPITLKDTQGNVLSADDIVSNADKFTIYATGGIQLSTVSYGSTSSPIERVGANKGKIKISNVTSKGLATITVELRDTPSSKATFSTIVGEPRKADKIAFSTAAKKYMLDNTDNEFKVKVYDQHGGELKPTAFQDYSNLYRVIFILQANSPARGDNYGLSVKSNDVADNRAVGLPASINKKFALTPSTVHGDVYAFQYNLATNTYDIPRQLLSPVEVFDKSFKFYTNVFNGIHTAGPSQNTYIPNKIPVITGTSYTLTAYLVKEVTAGNFRDINQVSTTVEVLEPADSRNKLTYEAFLDKSINNTILATDKYLGGVPGAIDVRKDYPKVSKEVKLRATHSDGELVSIPQTISQITSSIPSIAAITDLPSGGALGTGYVTGLDVGTANISIVYNDAKGEPHTTSLNVTTKNEAPKVTSIVTKNSVITASRTALNSIIAADLLYPWDVNIGEKVTIKDQFGNEYISEKALGSRKLDSTGTTDQFIQKHQRLLNLTYQLSDIITSPGGTVAIDRTTGKITSISPTVSGFTVNIIAPSGVKSSTVVTLVN
jgi:hypothetical protein